MSRAFSLLLLLLLLCGTASAELVYTVVSKDYSIGRVNYDTGGLPQNETVLKDIKASWLSFNEVFSTDQGEWRVLTRTSSSDSTFTLSLYDPDKDWKNPLAKAENLRGYINYQDDSSLYLVSRDNSSYTITKMDKETLTETAKSSETMKEYPQFKLDEGIIYSYFDSGSYPPYIAAAEPNSPSSEKGSSSPSLTVLDASLKGMTFALDAGNYSYPISLGDGSLAMTFVSEDIQQIFDSMGEPLWSTSTTKDIGIFKFTPSAKTRIVSAADVGFDASSATWGRIAALTSDKSGGLYFVANVSSSSTLYHWDGSTTTSVFKAADGETIGTYDLDESGNVYCSVYKRVWNEETQTVTATTASLYRVGTSTPVYKETYTGTTGTNADLSINEIKNDNSGNVYFMVYKSTSSQGHGDGPTSVKSRSYALYRCGASATSATKLHEETDGSWIDYFWISSSSSSVSVSGGSEDSPRFYDDSGNVYFRVSSGDVSALYRCGTSQSSAVKLLAKDGQIDCADMDDSGSLYFTARKSVSPYRSESYGLYRCGASQTTPDTLCEKKDAAVSYVGYDDSDNVFFKVYSKDVEADTYAFDGLYRWNTSQTATVKEVKDGSFIMGVSVPKSSSKGVYFSVVKEAVEKVEVDKGVAVAASEAGHYIIERYYYSSYAFCHYDGSDVTTIHTFSNVDSAYRRLDEKHKTLYLYAEPFVSQDVAVSSTLLAFDNTDRHNSEKLEEFEIAGTIGSVALYNHIEEPGKSDVIPDKPTPDKFTIVSKDNYEQASLPTPTSGWPSITIKVELNGGEKSPAGTRFRIWITMTANPSVAANLAAGEVYYGEVTSETEGKLVVDPSKMTLRDANGNVVDFPGGTCTVCYESEDKKFSGETAPVTMAKSSSSSSGGATSNKSSGGCDAGFGALALAVLAAGVLLKKHSK